MDEELTLETESKPSQNSHFRLIILLILAIGVVVGTTLVSQTQLFWPKATSTTIEVKDENNQPLPKQGNTPITDSPKLKIELRPGLNP